MGDMTRVLDTEGEPAWMPEMERMVAIIPAYNEEMTAGGVVGRVRPFVDRVYVVDDASTDATAGQAEEAGAIVIRHEVNQGIASALNSGYRAASQDNASVVVQLDGDGQHDPSHLPVLVNALDEKTEIVIASRFLDGSETGYSFVRRWGIRFFSFLTSVFGGTRISDVTSGYRIYRVSALSKIPPSPGRHWAVEQTLIALRLGLRIKEVPVTIPPRLRGESQFKLGVAALYPLRMISAILRALRISRGLRGRYRVL